MTLTFRKKIFIYFFLLFSVFTVSVLVFQQYRDRKGKQESLHRELDRYVDLLASIIDKDSLSSNTYVFAEISVLKPLLPQDIRVTLIDNQGSVIYDNNIENSKTAENHLTRPEIASLKKEISEWAVRYSSTLDAEYLYYAKRYGDYYIRVALPYDVGIKNMLKGDRGILFFVLLLFVVGLFVIDWMSKSFGRAISGLRDFIVSVENNNVDYTKIHFPNTELGEIGTRITANHKLLEESKERLNQEKDKLIRHFHYSNEGIAIFSFDRKSIYANSHFIRYINSVANNHISDVSDLFEDEQMQWINEFLKDNLELDVDNMSVPLCEKKINREGFWYQIRILIFNSESFEITINDITEIEKTRLLKQQMTNNIAHELRTPVSSIRGYLETLINQPDISRDKIQFFLERSYSQTLRLSDLVSDIALITKIEESRDMFKHAEVNIGDTVSEVLSDLSEYLRVNSDKVEDKLSDYIVIDGDKSLIYAVFRNLLENSIRYAGSGVTIVIDNFTEDDTHYYFSYYDTGCGVDEHHLPRIFERFYRVTGGRSRSNGGSGLGLSITKNAIALHGGEIAARSRAEGGLEFIFSLKKK